MDLYDTCSAYEPEAIYATRRWLEESGSRTLYTIGPIFPWPDTIYESSKDGLLATDPEVPEYGTSDRAFMDRILSHGEKSLLYVSHLIPTFLIMLMTKLVNLDVIRKFVVARE